MENIIKKTFVFPAKIIYCEKSENTDNLLLEKNVQIIAPNTDFTVIKRGGKIILDFGKEVYGCLRILVNEMQEDVSCSGLNISLGESVAEAITPVGINGAGNNHSVRSSEVFIPWNCDYTTACSGFRFACIELLDSDFIQIQCVVAQVEMPELSEKGFFRCNDELLNKIADTAIYTIKLCIQNNVIWDGIKRDRMVWMGDLHPEIMTSASIYGAIPQIKNSLNLIDLYLSHSWANSIPAYSAWWIICLAEFYMISGDKDFVNKKLNCVRTILENINNIILENGEISFDNSELYCYPGNEFYFDWPTYQTKDGKDGWVSLIKYSMDKSIFLLRNFGQDSSVAESILQKIERISTVCSRFKQVESFNLISGRKTTEEVKDILLDGQAQGMTGFMGYYILTAMSICGGEKDILSVIKEYYGGMLALGATTFWEDFDIDWLKDNPGSLNEIPKKGSKNIHRDYGKYCYSQLRHSLCHGWTSGVYAFLIQTVLGVKAIEPGYKKVKITPKLVGLNYVEGCVPTPNGDIYVKHQMIDGKIKSEIKLPNGVFLQN